MVAAVGFGEAVGNENAKEELLNIASNENLAKEIGFDGKLSVQSAVDAIKRIFLTVWENN